MLSLHTNSSSLSAARALNGASTDAARSMARLSTGYRVNSAMDDAAGLQIATRLKAQASGMTVALRNIQNSISMLQTVESTVAGIVDVMLRIKDLATQAADGASTLADKEALQTEFAGLHTEYIFHLMATKYNGEELFVNSGKMYSPVTMQVGAGASDTLTINVRAELLSAQSTLGYATGTMETMLIAHPSQVIGDADAAITEWSALRSSLGAGANMLESAYNNVSNIRTNTQAAMGRILDVDYASESAVSAKSQMLAQAATSMLKESKSAVQLVISLVQQ